MVTNINLIAPETGDKPLLTGKGSIVISAAILLLAIGVYGVLSFLSASYAKQKNQIESEIATEKSNISGETYADLADFQERVSVLGEIADDHAYADSFLKNLSRYVIPEVVFQNLKLTDNGNTLSISGLAPNFEALSREVILLKSFPGADSVEFRTASEKPASATERGGVGFEVNLKLNKTALKK